MVDGLQAGLRLWLHSGLGRFQVVGFRPLGAAAFRIDDVTVRYSWAKGDSISIFAPVTQPE